MEIRDDLISRASAIKTFTGKPPEYYHTGYIVSELKGIPAVEAVPVVHGWWIDENPDDSLDPRMRCSVCAGVESPLIKWHYCPNCGAKMGGDANG
jgi:hypothetical protein